ncbi:hypothetical protein H8S90_10915 [Olivibacter sp. SDN3]|uniref:hypothetical protein n=1 Tax=Olivibacter sp. SDN3 TaxID=2764720 RepID=UPI001650FC5C|nr:hypothetical protein [Olivibacter sp. SDN3]QNL52033.1 hypothetical protein H8S90_10915 [Olivibacter sp. SDN3]
MCNNSIEDIFHGVYAILLKQGYELDKSFIKTSWGGVFKVVRRSTELNEWFSLDSKKDLGHLTEKSLEMVMVVADGYAVVSACEKEALNLKVIFGTIVGVEEDTRKSGNSHFLTGDILEVPVGTCAHIMAVDEYAILLSSGHERFVV